MGQLSTIIYHKSYFYLKNHENCDPPWENRPSSHLVMIVEIPVLKVVFSVTSFSLCWPALFGLIDLLNLIWYRLEFVTCLILDYEVTKTVTILALKIFDNYA